MLHFKTYINDQSEEWVTFIHGAGGSSTIWYKQLKEFKKAFNILLIDLRGHGNSKSLGLTTISKYTFDTISNDILEVIIHLKIKSSHFITYFSSILETDFTRILHCHSSEK